MGISQSYNINWMKIPAFCCFVLLCGTHFYVYNTCNVRTDAKEYQIDHIKVCLKVKTNINVPDLFQLQEPGDSTVKFSQSMVNTRKSQGYIIPLKLYEQQTAGARNLWGLQLWANKVGMKVVEPFISDNFMSFAPITKNDSNPIRFSDLYDKYYWNKQCISRGCAELVPWEEFLTMASKRIIFVQVCGVKSVVTCQTKVIAKTETSVSLSINEQEISKKIKYFRDHGFKFIRWVSVRFNDSTRMTLQDFSQHIFGQYNSSTVTVMFKNWIGLRKARVNLQDIKYVTSRDSVTIGLLPSKKLVEESQRYLQHVRRSDGKYIGIMVRIERAYKEIHKYSLTIDEVGVMRECAKNLSSILDLQHYKNWDRTLAIDLGDFGSYGYRRSKKIDKREEVLYDDYFKAVYGDSWTIEEFENSFVKYLGTNNPAYIAQIQRTIAARSNCIVLVGGHSTFQEAAIAFYQNFHPDVEKQCIIKHCYFGVNLNFGQLIK